MNLNDNKISNLDYFITPNYRDAAFDEILAQNPSSLEKFEGFEFLEELHLSKNIIDSLDHLLGLVFLPNLKRVYLEGNPVMKSFKLPLTSFLRGSLKRPVPQSNTEFNLFKHFADEYKILICDPCYNLSKVHLDDSFVSIRPLVRGGGLDRPFKEGTLAKAKSKKPPKTVIAHTVEPMPTTKSKTRRTYQFTEGDIKKIIESGKIPHMKTFLKPQAKQQEQLSVPIVVVPELSKTQLEYNPEQKGETFLTGVHIRVPSQNDDLSIQDDSGSDLSWSDYSEESDGEAFPDYPLPSNIQTSVRALRYALNHPVSYWRVMENSYLRPTQASIAKETSSQYLHQPLDQQSVATSETGSQQLTNKSGYSMPTSAGIDTPVNSVWTPFNERENRSRGKNIPPPEILASQHYAPVGKLSYRSKDHLQDEQQEKTTKTLQKVNGALLKGSKKYEDLKKISALQRARNEGRLRTKDEFDHMNSLMNQVELKMNSVEANLGNSFLYSPCSQEQEITTTFTHICQITKRITTRVFTNCSHVCYRC